MDDGQLVELYLQRDQEAIRLSAQLYGARLRALAQGIVGSPQTAEECENDTYWAAWRAIPPHEPRGYLYAFLARITRHLALNRCRDEQRLKRGGTVYQLSAELEQCIPVPDDCLCRLDELALEQALNGFLAGLTAQKRWLFLRRYWYMDSIADISRRSGLSQGRVKTGLFRLRQQLRDYLVKEGYEL